MKVAVLGAGSWGTALALVLSRNRHEVMLWTHRADQAEELRARRTNERYLPGIPLPKDWEIFTDLKVAANEVDAVVAAIPSKAFREVMSRLANLRVPVVSVTKGIEYDTGMTMTQVLKSCAPDAPRATLSGPTFAIEVAKGFPAAIVSASDSAGVAEQVQTLFHRPEFRVYTSIDLIGVELGGALKNVIAIAAGIGDGVGFGDNSKAALVTRALAEMRRLGMACGAQGETFSGLSGLGDLTATCFSQQSRNRKFGERLGRGEKVEHVLATSTSVAEGYPTARSAYKLAKQMGVDAPIISEMYAFLYEGKNLKDSLRDLTTRSSKAED
ncbi:MAG TPA: NAD(P)H-dependent glycerol-3-phosphate dehydrogenase [Verrucomicrobiae bacterium]